MAKRGKGADGHNMTDGLDGIARGVHDGGTVAPVCRSCSAAFHQFTMSTRWHADVGIGMEHGSLWASFGAEF